MGSIEEVIKEKTAPPLSGTETILVVEDDPQILILLQEDIGRPVDMQSLRPTSPVRPYCFAKSTRAQFTCLLPMWSCLP